MFLTREDLERLSGFKTFRRQAKWLSENGYSYDVRADGMPVVLLQQLMERQCRRIQSATPQPDFSWIARPGDTGT